VAGPEAKIRTRVKVCCIASIEEADIAIRAGADALGLVAAMPDGTGMLSDAQIAEIAAHARPAVCTFLLTSQVTAATISAHIRATQPTAVQIVCPIDPLEAAKLAVLEPLVRRVQVVHVEGPEALNSISAYAPHANAFLLDSGRPNASTPVLGGTGKTHDWMVSADFARASPKRVFLAGGINAANVEEAIRQVRPYGLDLCSSVRSNGRLDGARLTAFMDAVRSADFGQSFH
jgi:phosphoribosylanthranilate isomerase